MNMTDAEKLILIMLSEIHERVKVEGGVDSKFVQEAIYGDHTWALYWKYPGIFYGGGKTPVEVNEVVDVLDMWSFLERSYEGLSHDDRERVKAEAKPFGAHVRFEGFDGNHETRQMSIAHFLVEHLGRFESFKGRDFNSHSPAIEAYRRMLAVFLPIRSSLAQREAYDLTAAEMIQILKERTHPERR
jgi:uncharacterized protein YfbU (UPF0304 family)